MNRIELAEWTVAPESLFPAWHFVEEFAQRTSSAGGVEKIIIFERVSPSRYELAHTRDCTGNQGAALRPVIRDALRRDTLLGFVIRDSCDLEPLLESYRKQHGGVLRVQDVMRELGAEVPELETVLTAGRKLVLVGHDGEPLFTLVPRLAPTE
ncbi:hypothetical protein JQX13_02935 [Archangium violaceum]|uniref:hypothetical protein n=1 Tax=Archangium violaceum TaxID=83451 RepID=UPI00193B6019|nr:hypothetical protein [Archangium violaceum]QRK09130.1 hypothetical protein JQX13_02935 [Archangium violaceum]